MILHLNPWHLVIGAPKALASLGNRQSRVGLNIFRSRFLFRNRLEVIFYR